MQTKIFSLSLVLLSCFSSICADTQNGACYIELRTAHSDSATTRCVDAISRWECYKLVDELKRGNEEMIATVIGWHANKRCRFFR